MNRDSRPVVAVSAYGASAPSTRVRLYEWLDHLGIDATRHSYAGFASNGALVMAKHPYRALTAEVRTRAVAAGLGESVLVLSRSTLR